MNVDDYQQEAMSLLNPALNPQDVLENALMGLCGESGEAIDLLKKHRFQGHPLDKEKLKKELGDVAWYLAEAAQGLNVPLSEILQGNLNKLLFVGALHAPRKRGVTGGSITCARVTKRNGRFCGRQSSFSAKRATKPPVCRKSSVRRASARAASTTISPARKKS